MHNRPIAKRLRDVRSRDSVAFLEIGNRACSLEHAMITAGGQAESGGRGLKKCPCVRIDRAVRVEPAPAHERIARHARHFAEPLLLSSTRALDARADGR